MYVTLQGTMQMNVKSIQLLIYYVIVDIKGKM